MKFCPKLMRCGKCKVYSEADWTVQSKKIFFWWRRESKKPSRRRKFFILDSRHLGFSWLKLSCLALVFCLPFVYMAAILECVWTLGWWLLKDAEVLSLASSCPTNYAKTSTNPEIAFQCFQASLIHVRLQGQEVKENECYIFSLLLRFIRLDEKQLCRKLMLQFSRTNKPYLKLPSLTMKKKSPWIQNIYFQWNTPALLPSWLVTFVWNKIYIYMLSSSGRLVIRFWRPIM